MEAPPFPINEHERLAALRSLNLLDTGTEERFERIVRLAAHVFKVPIALVSLVDKDRQWFKAHHGWAATETPRTVSFCAHAVANERELYVPDATEDSRFADNPLVLENPNIRFYAGVPLRGPDSHFLGTFCVIDRVPRTLTNVQRQVLRDLAAIVQSEVYDHRTKNLRREAHERELRTQLQQHELEALRRVDAERRAFINGAALAVRTPLAPLRTQADLLRLRFQHNPEIAKAASLISEQVNELTGVVDRLQLAAAVVAGNVVARPDLAPVAEVVQAAVKQVKAGADAKNAEIQVSIPDNLLIRAGPAHATQILRELVSNAVAASPQGFPVLVRGVSDGVEAVIDILDQGPGVPPDLGRPLHANARRVPRSADTASPGLGLSIAQGFAALYGASIKLSERPDGRNGTLCRVRFPLVRQASRVISAKQGSPLANRPIAG